MIPSMGIAHYIRVIGRGKNGARSLNAEQANDLMSQLLEGTASDLEVGAFVLAMRIKGESLDELTGFFDAVQARCIALPAPRPVVLLPSYNGARKLPNLTPLLGLLLAREGVPVLVHGPASDPTRVTAATLFQHLGLPFAESNSELAIAWSRREPAYMTIDALCPALARLLDVRRVVGVRNSGHTLAKLLQPIRATASLRVVNYTHGEYAELLAAFVQRHHANAMLLRGTEGEPFTDPRRLRRLDVYLNGMQRADLSCVAQDGVLAEAPGLPREPDAATTSSYIEGVLSGQLPVPAPLARQVKSLCDALALLPAHEPMRAPT